jgi:hypothetical protein
MQDQEAALGQRQIPSGGRWRAEHRAGGSQRQRQVLPVQARDHGLTGGHEVAEQVPESVSPIRSVQKIAARAAGHGQDGPGLDGPPEHLGVRAHALGAPQRGRADHPGAGSEAGQQVGQHHRLHHALGVQRPQQVRARPAAPVAGRGVPGQDQRHRHAWLQARDHGGVVGVAEPVQRLAQRQPGHRVDLVTGRRPLARAESRRPVADLLEPTVGQVFHRTQPGAQHGAHAGLLLDLPDRGEQHVLTGLALALGQGPVVILGPVHEEYLNAVGGGTPEHPAGRQDRLPHRRGRKPASSAERPRRSRIRVSWMSRSGLPCSSRLCRVQ